MIFALAYRRKLTIIGAGLTLWFLIATYNTTIPAQEGMANHINVSELAPDDYGRLIDMDGFEFTLNTKPCDKSYSIPLLVMIHTAPDHTDLRQVIRNTWAKQSDAIRLVFLLGGAEEIQDRIDFEYKLYGDIVQGNFLDTYRNLSYKFAMGLKWVAYNCPNAGYVLKSDDDTFVNTPYLLKHLPGIDSRNVYRNETISCLVCRRCGVFRDKESKWYVTPEEYAGRFYPTHCSGFALLYNTQVAYKLYKEVQNSEKYFWIDDVYITGIIAQKAGLKHRNFVRFMINREQMERYTGNYTSYRPFIFGPIQLSVDWMEQLWDLVDYVSDFDNVE